MTYGEKRQKSHTGLIPGMGKVLIIIELCRNRRSFHGSPTAGRDYYDEKDLDLCIKFPAAELRYRNRDLWY